jgi:hypothetical protein
LSVPGGTSILDFPETVTVPDLDGDETGDGCLFVELVASRLPQSTQ